MSSRLSLAALVLLTASPAAIKEFPLPRANAFPHDVAVAPNGSVYYSDQSNSFIGHLDPATGSRHRYRDAHSWLRTARDHRRCPTA